MHMHCLQFAKHVKYHCFVNKIIMKLEEVPQDGAYMVEGRIRDLCYVVNEDGHYTSVLSMGWKPKNEAIRLAWEEVYEQAEETRRQVIAGKLSPVAFYMGLNLMDVSILSSYTNIPRRKVKKHLQMKHFLRLSPEWLDRYAEALNLKREELVSIERIQKMELKHED